MPFSPAISALLGTFVVSLISFSGLLVFTLNKTALQRFLIILISFSAGSLLGDAFIHLLPEAVEEAGGFNPALSFNLLSGIVIFFMLEKFILWHHHHFIETPQDHEKENGSPSPEVLPEHRSLRVVNIVGDAIHNMLDGMIIAVSFTISPVVGISTTLAVILHEIPQEISDLGVLIHAGLPIKKAVWYNFFSGTVAIFGAILVILLQKQSQAVITGLVPFTAGAFIYIAASDLIPELKKTPHSLASIAQLLSLLSGIALMYALLFVA